MQYRFVEPLRWLDRPARVAVGENNGHSKAYFQVTAPREIAAMCLGRPVEELPRIVPIIGPTHHLVSALALDKLFEVEPPRLAANMRAALLCTQFFVHHLRKLFFLFSSLDDPFVEYSLRQPPSRDASARHRFLDRIMHFVALSQEAATILGGRPDHPVSMVAGGVGRFLKEQHYARLSDIAAQCLEFALDLAERFRETWVDRPDDRESDLLAMEFAAMAGLTLSRDSGQVTVTDGEGKETQSFPPEAVFDKVSLHQEPWTHQPFAHLLDKEWKGREESPDGLFFVGPLARLNSGAPCTHPLAEEERQRFVERFGSAPNFTLTGAFWSLVIESIESAEGMVDGCSQEKLTGPAIRSIPTGMGSQGFAAIESPEGFIAHQYEVDERGLVTGIKVLETGSENNGLRCAIVRNVVAKAEASTMKPEQVKAMIEVSLLPF